MKSMLVQTIRGTREHPNFNKVSKNSISKMQTCRTLRNWNLATRAIASIKNSERVWTSPMRSYSLSSKKPFACKDWSVLNYSTLMNRIWLWSHTSFRVSSPSSSLSFWWNCEKFSRLFAPKSSSAFQRRKTQMTQLEMFKDKLNSLSMISSSKASSNSKKEIS